MDVIAIQTYYISWKDCLHKFASRQQFAMPVTILSVKYT